MGIGWHTRKATPADSGQVNKPFRALVPKKALVELIKLADEAELDAKAIFAGDDNHLFFQVGHRLLITRKLTGNFPDYERVLPKIICSWLSCKRMKYARQSTVWLSLRMNGPARFGCSSSRTR